MGSLKAEIEKKLGIPPTHQKWVLARAVQVQVQVQAGHTRLAQSTPHSHSTPCPPVGDPVVLMVPAFRRLLLAGKLLRDDAATLSGSGIKNGAKLMLMGTKWVLRRAGQVGLLGALHQSLPSGLLLLLLLLLPLILLLLLLWS